MNETWSFAGRARIEFADLVEQLDDTQWTTETLCAGWTAHDVLAHLVWHTEVTITSLARSMASARFNFAKPADRAATELAIRPPQQLLTQLRDRADQKSSIPGAPQEGSGTDTAIHTQDVRRALGLGGELGPDTVVTALDFMTTNRNAKYVMNPKVNDGLRLSATDVSWTYGTGALVEGPGEVIMMSLSGRPTLSELSGEGVQQLADQLGR